MAIGTQTDVSWRVAPRHTLRAGLQVTGERAVFRNATTLLPLDVDGAALDDPFVIANQGGRTGWLYGGYVQDEWRITDTLTMNLGLRWDQMVQYVTAGQLRRGSTWSGGRWRAPPCTPAMRAPSRRRNSSWWRRRPLPSSRTPPTRPTA